MLDGVAGVGKIWKAPQSYASRTKKSCFIQTKKKNPPATWKHPDDNGDNINLHCQNPDTNTINSTKKAGCYRHRHTFPYLRLNACFTIFLRASFSPRQLGDGLTEGYKWHEFRAIIPPLFPLSSFHPCAVEIKDCWAKGKKRFHQSSLVPNSHVYLTKLHSTLWNAVPPCQSLGLCPWNTVSFFLLNFI